MKKVLFLLVFTTFSFLGANDSVQKYSNERAWTFVTYMQPNETLLYWAFHNLNNMASASVDSQVTILVQIYVKGDHAWRYRIENKHIYLEKTVAITRDYQKDIVDVMSWAVKEYPAKHYALNLWNCGFGILDPVYDEALKDWVAKAGTDDFFCDDGTCPVKFVDLASTGKVPFKGILFNDFYQTYMNNCVMVSTFKEISNDILGGKKLDIFCADCCKMAMLEVGYQVKDFVNYLVGSQNCELFDGWDYEGIFNTVTGNMKPPEVVEVIIDTYSDYYKKHSQVGVYTLSGVDLHKIDSLIYDINGISKLCKSIILHDFNFVSVLSNVRSRCVSICDAPFYTDLDSFYTELLTELEGYKNEKQKDVVQQLYDLLIVAKLHIKDFVVANTTGENIKRAQGTSIYFPKKYIHDSYYKTPFALETEWLSFLEMLIS